MKLFNIVTVKTQNIQLLTSNFPSIQFGEITCNLVKLLNSLLVDFFVFRESQFLAHSSTSKNSIALASELQQQRPRAPISDLKVEELVVYSYNDNCCKSSMNLQSHYLSF